ncbi:MAG: hypothetical protein DHS20C16_12830 [Phycisphaerae bacterium]|nr:MAG: hypothetical protein DHS20C16_12830 [Phycisphaerae bacterium]
MPINAAVRGALLSTIAVIPVVTITVVWNVYTTVDVLTTVLVRTIHAIVAINMLT